MRKHLDAELLVSLKERRQVSSGDVMQQAGGHHDGSRRVANHRARLKCVCNHEPAFEILSLGQRGGTRDQNRVKVSPDQLDPRPEAAVRR
jgi:hypothetical protein